MKRPLEEVAFDVEPQGRKKWDTEIGRKKKA